MSRLSDNLSFINRGQQTEQSAAVTSEVPLSATEKELLSSYVETVMANFALLHKLGCKYDQPAILTALGMDQKPAAAVSTQPEQTATATFPLDMLEAKRRAVEQAYEQGNGNGQAAA